MCANNKEYEAEALYYINRLHVPDGYSIDSLSVWDATGMAAGYNEAMAATDAKYKIYIHQDTMIIDKYFIPKILKIFQDENPHSQRP